MSIEWSAELFQEDDGTSPVEGFLDSLDTKTRARFQWSMEQLRARKIGAREPLVRHLEGEPWELRVESRTNIYRVVYFCYTGRRIVFLHGFQGKTQKTPRGELEIARSRHRRFVAREEGRWDRP